MHKCIVEYEQLSYHQHPHHQVLPLVLVELVHPVYDDKFIGFG